MLKSLVIKNYALIEDLQVNFNNGLSIITGETGAGKSILLGGLSLVLGKRADLSQIKDASKKCVIEATFEIAKYSLKPLFEQNDLDYEVETIVRREILPSGKSRAFVNDSPVNLNALLALGEQLIDIHSQHQTLELTNNNFQFQIIDALANNDNRLLEYSNLLKA
ncbi:MAG: AAA family ATPase, partial [Bacteroidia bacterium]|nr:AAA family ATPase [Bacteroidia bacterium]